MKTIKIDRKNWLRGEGGDRSYLCRSEDGKMCCLGFYLNQCGVTKTKLKNQPRPQDIKEHTPEQAKWLLEGNETIFLDDCEKLMDYNDTVNIKINDRNREKKICEIFSKHDVKVIFTE